MTNQKLDELGKLVEEARKLKDYEGSPIFVFIEVIEELRLEVLKLRKEKDEAVSE